MKTITFFSYKGGVGRTLAATNFAVYLAKLGLKVVIMDFDLDAPGVDSKFPGYSLPSGQPGLLDYILKFQKYGTDPGPVSSIVVQIPIKSPRQEVTLGLIPAGDYLSPDYSSKLNELNWTTIFQSREGVAFFQEFLARIDSDLKPDVLVIDSRTGFNEIGGLCTLQLADETVFLTSLAGESIKMTRHLSKLISDSDVSKSLNKKVETKIVVSRVPKPSENERIDTLKARCRRMFEVDESRLFFLFSCRELEREEFVAMLDTSKENGLVASYMQLFRGLDVDVAEKSIQEEIQKTEAGLLSYAPEEAESRIRELVALYPHPDVYRTAMRFFELRRTPEESVIFGLHLLELNASDPEAVKLVSRFFLSDRFHASARSKRIQKELEAIRLIPIAMHAYKDGVLSIEEKVRLSDHLEDTNYFAESYSISMECINSGEIASPELQNRVTGIAARTAMRLKKYDEAAKLIDGIPTSRLGIGLGNVAVQLKLAAGDKKAAFDVAKVVLSKDFHPAILEAAIGIARDLDKVKELEEAIASNPELEARLRHDPSLSWNLQSIGIDPNAIGDHTHRRRHRTT
jgi:MinD-like ATPase involved in chromosome partitioning or flagellar assembly